MSLSVQFLSLLAMIGTGIGAGAIMDLIGTGVSATRKGSFIRRHAVWFEVIGWIIIGSASFYILFLVRDGAWRMYDPFAQISGMLLYASVFYRPFRFVGRVIQLLVIRPIVFVIRLIVNIIRFIVRMIIKIILLIISPFTLLYHYISNKVFKNTKG
ncbi:MULTISPECIES: spore cortex biosynthesis protein YabQ [Sporosarcina]|uniref:Spore cortex biosynthesis protein YabQ n=1 Tax=Sporosarcina contaminans TaxID=633403 RepID=A0ABW3TW29_9BACL